jgi:Ca2+-binding RTX toxin-like protein
MADNTINTDQNATVFINTTNESWLVTRSTTFNVANQNGLYEGGSGNTINVLGDINVSGSTYAGVKFQGATSKLNIGVDSRINAVSATYGIQYDGSGGQITVNGVIKGGDYAIHGNIWAKVENNGQLTGDNGIVFDGAGSDITNTGLIDVDDVAIMSDAAGALVVNENGAEIHSGDKGIVFTDMGGGLIVNKGLLEANTFAIETGDGAQRVINSGKIVGDVMLGSGADRFDIRKGVFEGAVQGGEGDDRYLISKSSVDIIEQADDGTDRVYSTASYTLSDNLEYLYLRGGKDIDGRGNAADNVLFGNNGDNKLFGRAGDDRLSGGKGIDILTGGVGFDTFEFNAGFDKDRISDFKDGTDKIASDYVNSMQDFDDLLADGRIKQVEDDVAINFGNGDTLIIEHFLKSNLDYMDFV